FNSYLNMNLRETHGYTYGARSGINDSKYSSMFRAGASVRNAVTDSAVIETIKEITRIRTEKVDEETLKNVKAGYVGKFVLALEKPQTIANYALNIKTKGLPSDFYKTYLQKINAVTVDDIQRVAQKYFNVDNARIIVVGKALDVLPNLEKLGYKINYFDIEANPTKKPEMSKPIPDGVTIKTVIDNFVDAIGGKDKIATVTSIVKKSEASMQGRILNMEMKLKAPNSNSMNLTMGGMSLNKTIFNGSKGYTVAQGQTIPLEGDDLEFAKKGSAPFEELALVTTGRLVGIENVNGNDCYVVSTGKDGKTKMFFDVETGFKTKIVAVQEGPGGKEMTQIFEFSDYKEVNGIKFYHTMKMTMGPMNFEFKTKDIKFNEGVSDSDFE
ncbi:MAG TPA: insulinase family protein, partial [Flavobacteriaceae bacterium]|nr:insulinase family protein [Flavobacteriaceae bacterium]